MNEIKFGKPAIEKARIWNGILYTENMIDNWQDEIEDKIPLPIAYCIHDKDKDQKTHVHVMAVWSNTTTWKHAMSVFNLLSKENCKCCSTVEACLNVRRSYNYLIHDTNNARSKGKYPYSLEERIEINNFDIGLFDQLSQQEKDEMLKELCDFVIDREIVNMRQAYREINAKFPSSYFPIFKANNALIARITKGNYQEKY